MLADRLLSLEVEPPANRYGRVFVGSPHQARGRAFKVVFVPGLAERMFPQKLREDPLLLDDLRQRARKPICPLQGDRAELERLLLRLAVGAATDRLYVSFPRIETSEARARVPSFYALEIMRAVTGRVPDHQTLERMAAQESQASLAWPAPADAADAIDDFEHDLSVLRGLMLSDDRRQRPRALHAHAERLPEAIGHRALGACAERMVAVRRPRPRHRCDAAVPPDAAAERAAVFGVGAAEVRRVSVPVLPVGGVSSRRRWKSRSRCSAWTRSPREACSIRCRPSSSARLQKAKLSIATGTRDRVLETLDDTLTRIAAEYYERLAPAIDRVWQDEIASIRTDLRVWVDQLATNTEWEPWLFEFAFGLPGQPGHDPSSLPDPVTIDGRFILRGSIDLVERKPGTKILRVTDHKTGKNRSAKGSIIGGGAQLQPIIYSLAVEEATGCTVESGRFSYCTTAGGFTDHAVPINERTRRMGIEVLEIIDRAVELGMLPPAPAEQGLRHVATFCRCAARIRSGARNRKSHKEIADLLELRERP